MWCTRLLGRVGAWPWGQSTEYLLCKSCGCSLDPTRIAVEQLRKRNGCAKILLYVIPLERNRSVLVYELFLEQTMFGLQQVSLFHASADTFLPRSDLTGLHVEQAIVSYPRSFPITTAMELQITYFNLSTIITLQYGASKHTAVSHTFIAFDCSTFCCSRVFSLP